jgi:hypothetical protein
LTLLEIGYENDCHSQLEWLTAEQFFHILICDEPEVGW